MLADLPPIQGKQPDSKEEYWVANGIGQAGGYHTSFSLN